MRVLTALTLAAAFTAAASAMPGPHTPAADYERERGAPFGESRSVTFEISRGATLAALEPVQTLEARLGRQWASWRDSDGEIHLVDLAADRMITIAADGESGVNSSLYAEARRRLDVYAGLSRGGSLDQIQFGGAGTFHRVWLEAAMGVAGPRGEIEIADTDDGFEAIFEGETVFSADFTSGGDGPCTAAPIPASHARAASALLRHVVPLHPAISAEIHARDGFPCAFDFVIYSPDSPEGRRERWVLSGPGELDVPPLPEGLRTRLPDAALLGEAGTIAAAAARGERGDAPSPADYFEIVADLREAGDHAGALLASVQERHNFGPCPEQAIGSDRPVCAEAVALAEAGVGDPDFERAFEGTAAVRTGDHADAVERLSAFIARDDAAGAAARVLVANEMIAWGRDGLASRPDLDPATLLTEALDLDPYAPDVYWHLGARYLDAGAPHAAFALFDLGRALPGRAPTELLSQADALEARLGSLAPEWIGAAPE